MYFYMSVPSQNLYYPCLAVVPQGGAVVPRQRFYRSLLHCIWAVLVSATRVVVLRGPAVVPCALAVVPRPRRGSTVLRRLSWWITVGFVPLLYKGCLLLRVDYLFHPQAPLLLQDPFSPDLSDWPFKLVDSLGIG